MKKRRKRKKRIGSSLLLSLLLLLGTVANAAQKKAAASFSLIGVTVFREPGFALEGADVTLTPVPSGPPANGTNLKGHTSARGELVFRVPATPMRYTVRASGKGYSAQEKTVSVEREQRIDATFLLSPESKQ